MEHREVSKILGWRGEGSPDIVAVRDELKVILARLRDEEPGVLQSYPDPGHDEGRKPPFEISLAPWAVATAEDLHNRFGQQVSLVVGALAYPPGSQPECPHATSRPEAPQWRARLVMSQRIARDLGFRELGSQAGIRLHPADRASDLTAG